ncbi:MAG: hypothetical protein JKX76_01365 [Colwellia sp.]|nr:hypothetical protein [Colwellia sp.]
MTTLIISSASVITGCILNKIYNEQNNKYLLLKFQGEIDDDNIRYCFGTLSQDLKNQLILNNLNHNAKTKTFVKLVFDDFDSYVLSKNNRVHIFGREAIDGIIEVEYASVIFDNWMDQIIKNSCHVSSFTHCMAYCLIVLGIGGIIHGMF